MIEFTVAISDPYEPAASDGPLMRGVYITHKRPPNAAVTLAYDVAVCRLEREYNTPEQVGEMLLARAVNAARDSVEELIGRLFEKGDEPCQPKP